MRRKSRTHPSPVILSAELQVVLVARLWDVLEERRWSSSGIKAFCPARSSEEGGSPLRFPGFECNITDFVLLGVSLQFWLFADPNQTFVCYYLTLSLAVPSTLSPGNFQCLR